MEKEQPKSKKSDMTEKDFCDIRDRISRDISNSEQYIDDNFSEKWQYLNNNYKGVRTKKNKKVPSRSNMFISLSFGIVETEKVRSINGMYSKDDFFAIKVRDKGTAEGDVDLKMSAKAMEQLMFAQQTEMHLYRTFHDTVLDSLIYGNGFIKLSWLFKEEVKEYYDTDSGKAVKITETQSISKPLAENISPYDLLIDPDAESIEDATFVCHRMYVKPEDIWDSPMYNMTKEVENLKNDYESIDVEERPDRIELYEYWDGKKVYTLNGDLNADGGNDYYKTETEKSGGRGNYIIRMHSNPYKHGKKPFFTMVKYPAQRDVYGYGSLEMISDIQEFTNDMVNNSADNSLLSIHKAFMMRASSDIDISDMKLSPGKIIKVKDFDDLKQIEMGDIHTDYERQINMMDAFTNRITGNLDNIDNRSGKSATESRIIAERANDRFKAYEDYNRENCLKPFIRMWIELNQQFIDREDIIPVIGKERAEALGLEDKNVDLNVNYDFVLTGEAGLTDKLTSIENMKASLELLGGISQLDPNIVDIKSMFKYTLSKLDMPTNFLMAGDEEEELDNKAKKAILEDIEKFAQSKGTTGEELVNTLSQQMGITPQELVDEIMEARGIENFLKSQGGNNA